MSISDLLIHTCGDLTRNIPTERPLVKKTCTSSATSPAPHTMGALLKRRDRRSFAMNSPHPAQIASSPTSLASLERAPHICICMRSTMQKHSGDRPACYSMCIQPGVARRRLFKLAALAGCLKLCAIYDIKTNERPTSWHISRGRRALGC